jgi:hypothetical protein
VTEKELQALCLRWQARLRLQDWEVIIRFATDTDEMENFGNCDYLTPKKYATILIQTEEKRATKEPAESIEQTVVHELLHLHLAAIDTPETRMVIEQTIHLVTKALTYHDENCPGNTSDDILAVYQN